MSYVTICKNKQTDYRIVFSPKSEDSGSAAAILQSVIYSCTGASIPLVSDVDSTPVSKEIIVGKTNRENVTFPYERHSIRENGFVCAVYGETLALVGGSFHCERFAVMKFLSDFLNLDIFNPFNEPKKLDALCVPTDYYYENSPRSWVDYMPIPKETDGAMIYMIPTYALPGGNNALRGMGYILRSRTGKLLVIDGGHATDADLIIAMLKKLSGKEIPVVDGWFFTHMHADHVNAFLDIAQNKSDELTVKAVYHSFPSREFACHWNEEIKFDKFESIMNSGFCPFIRVTRGDSADFDDIHMQVVFNVDDHFEKYLTDRTEASRSSINSPHGDAINNSDTLYKFTADGHSLLILGDFMHFGEEYVYTYYPETLPDFKADMVQCAHHGSNFMGQRIYSYIGAQKAFWNTTLDFWFWRDKYTDWLRKRLYEIGLVKNHVAGEGIIPIPFDMSDISAEDRAHLENEVSTINFKTGEALKLLYTQKYNYDVYTDGGRVEFSLATYYNAPFSVTLHGVEIEPKDGLYSLTLGCGESFNITVNGAKIYTYTAIPRPERRTLAHFDMKTMLSDGRVCDLSGNECHANDMGVTFVNEDGRAAIRVSSDKYLSVKDAPALLMSDNDFTISLWVKPDTDTPNQTIYHFGDDSGGSTRYMLNVANKKWGWGECLNRFYFSLTSGKSEAGAGVISGEPIVAGEWQHVVITSTGLTQRMYVNGIFSSERSFMRAIDLNADTNELLIGIKPHGANAFEGAIGEIKILNYALTDAEIAELYEKEKEIN